MPASRVAWDFRSALRSTARRAATLPTQRRHLPPAAPNARLLEVETPALVVELDALEANAQKLATLADSYPDVALRPHAKTHKTVEVAALQLQQQRTVGVCCQTVSEAVAMADVASDVLLSNEVASSAKARKMAALARRGCSIKVVVDSMQSAEMLASAARAEGTKMGVLIELNVGQNRCGVETPEEAVALARGLADLGELQFRGLQAYHGWAQHIRSHADRAEEAAKAACRAKEAAEALAKEGFPCEIITGGGTGTLEMDLASQVFTEVQPGSYIFWDADYARNLGDDGEPVSTWRQSLFVAATVVSRNTTLRRVVLDAGAKAVSYDAGPPLIRGWPENAARVENGGDEHTILHVHPGRALPALGEQVLLVPGHCDPTVNLHDYLLGWRGDKIEAVWNIAARGF